MSAEDFVIAAKQWFNEQDRWVFCLELLGMSITQDGSEACDSEIELLEQQFEQIMMEESR